MAKHSRRRIVRPPQATGGDVFDWTADSQISAWAWTDPSMMDLTVNVWLG